MHVILTRGLPASGKSTWAREFLRDNPEYRRWNNDEFNLMMTGQSFGRMSAQEIAEYRKEFIAMVTRLGKPLILDNTNLNPYTVEEFKAYDATGRYDIEIKEFPVSVAECLRRNSLRDDFVPTHVIERMAAQWCHLYDWM